MSGNSQTESALALFTAAPFAQDCPGRAILDQISNRWATLILAALAGGPYRFSALHVKVSGISQKMLSQNLKTLVRAGLVERSVEPTVPPQVTYSLSELGEGLTKPLAALIEWISVHSDDLTTAQTRYDAVPGRSSGAATSAPVSPVSNLRLP